MRDNKYTYRTLHKVHRLGNVVVRVVADHGLVDGASHHFRHLSAQRECRNGCRHFQNEYQRQQDTVLKGNVVLGYKITNSLRISYDVDHGGAFAYGADAAKDRHEHHDEADRHQQLGRREKVRIDEGLKVAKYGSDRGSNGDQQDRCELKIRSI